VEGERVLRGQTLFTDRTHPAIRFVAPAAGVVTHLHRGERRALRAVVIGLEGEGDVPLEGSGDLPARLLEAGLWPALRTRPFGRVPDPATRPAALFVTAIDTNPLAAPAAWALEGSMADFEAGLAVLPELTDGTVHVCTERAVAPALSHPRLVRTVFEGPHPAGLPGTHIHRLHPAGARQVVWHIGYQDVVAIGRLVARGERCFERIVALGGSPLTRPHMVRTVLGASIDDLLQGELGDEPCRLVAGSPLAGRQASGWGAYLGRHHLQVVALPEGGTAAPRAATWSFHALLAHGPLLRIPRRLTTSLQGRPAPLVSLGTSERVVPLRLLITPLLRALVAGDVETAEALGCLELDEEDLALATFLCPSKIEYGAWLRRALTELEGERS
jgi:Na+-transporting NADH:ubiquinone oxidoreductase subunit A